MKARHLDSQDTQFLAYGADHLLVCCSCGRAHGLNFAPGAGGVVMRIWEDAGATERERRKVLGKDYDKIKRGAK